MSTCDVFGFHCWIFLIYPFIEPHWVTESKSKILWSFHVWCWENLVGVYNRCNIRHQQRPPSGPVGEWSTDHGNVSASVGSFAIPCGDLWVELRAKTNHQLMRDTCSGSSANARPGAVVKQLRLSPFLKSGTEHQLLKKDDPCAFQFPFQTTEACVSVSYYIILADGAFRIAYDLTLLGRATIWVYGMNWWFDPVLLIWADDPSLWTDEPFCEPTGQIPGVAGRSFTRCCARWDKLVGTDGLRPVALRTLLVAKFAELLVGWVSGITVHRQEEDVCRGFTKLFKNFCSGHTVNGRPLLTGQDGTTL